MGDEVLCKAHQPFRHAARTKHLPKYRLEYIRPLFISNLAADQITAY
jgi:hypothetical protein